MRALSLVFIAVLQTGSAATPNWAGAWSLVPNSTCTNVEMCTAVADLPVDGGLTQAECVVGVKTLKRCLAQVKTCNADSANGLAACCEYLQGGNNSAPACPTSNTTTATTTATTATKTTTTNANTTTTTTTTTTAAPTNTVGKGKAPTPKGKNVKAAKATPKAAPKPKECHHTCYKTVMLSGGILEKYKCLVYVNSLETCIRKVCPDQEDTGLAPCCELFEGSKDDKCTLTKGMPKAASAQTWISAFTDGLKELTGQEAKGQVPTTTTATTAPTQTVVSPPPVINGLPTTPTQTVVSPPPALNGVAATFYPPPAVNSWPSPLWNPAPTQTAFGQTSFAGQPIAPTFPATTTSSSFFPTTTTTTTRSSSSSTPTGGIDGAIARTNAIFQRNIDAQNKILSGMTHNVDQMAAVQNSVNWQLGSLDAGMNSLQNKVANLGSSPVFPSLRSPTPSSNWWDDDDDDDFWG